jgi:hypothetical protein
MRRPGALLAIACFALSACSGGGKALPQSVPQITIPPTGPLAPALLTQVQLRNVPGLSTAETYPVTDLAVFHDPDPRGPCGGKVPVLSLNDAEGSGLRAQSIRSGAQLVLRRRGGEAKAFLDAREKDTVPNCPDFATKTLQGATQINRLEHVVKLSREADEALAVVHAVKVGTAVRAITQIDVRQGDVLSRFVIFSDYPLSTQTVRGLAALMAKDLSRLT